MLIAHLKDMAEQFQFRHVWEETKHLYFYNEKGYNHPLVDVYRMRQDIRQALAEGYLRQNGLARRASMYLKTDKLNKQTVDMPPMPNTFMLTDEITKYLMSQDKIELARSIQKTNPKRHKLEGTEGIFYDIISTDAVKAALSPEIFRAMECHVATCFTPTTRVCQNEFDVRDCLGGNVTEDFKSDLARAQKNGSTFTSALHDLALQNTMQP